MGLYYCCRALRLRALEPQVEASYGLNQEAKLQVCPKCESAMELESSHHRPSWRILFTGPEHPEWQEWMGSG